MQKFDNDLYEKIIAGEKVEALAVPPSDFGAALKFVLDWEGGYTDDPDDHGGATNFGIIQAEYNVYRKGKGEAAQSVKAITTAEVDDIYTKSYWDAVHAEALPKPLDLILFDTGVNMGVGTAIKLLQTALGVTSDGVFGPVTTKAVAATSSKAEVSGVAWGVVGLREARYEKIATGAGQAKFLKGWLNRLHALKVAAGLV